MINIKYYKIPNRDVVIEPYFDEYFHEGRRGAWTIKDAITNEQFYFNGTNSKYNDINDNWDYAVPDTEKFVRSLRMLSYSEYKEIMYRYKMLEELKK